MTIQCLAVAPATLTAVSAFAFLSAMEKHSRRVSAFCSCSQQYVVLRRGIFPWLALTLQRMTFLASPDWHLQEVKSTPVPVTKVAWMILSLPMESGHLHWRIRKPPTFFWFSLSTKLQCLHTSHDDLDTPPTRRPHPEKKAS